MGGALAVLYGMGSWPDSPSTQRESGSETMAQGYCAHQASVGALS